MSAGQSHPSLAALARRAIGEHLSGRRFIATAFEDIPAAGVFVTLRNRDGSLRGCVGSVEPVESSLGAEVARSAALAATRDPRFVAVVHAELSMLTIEVSVLLPAEPISGVEALDPSEYGVIVQGALGRRGLLLPAIPGIDDATMQVAVARRKAGIGASEPVQLRRFRVAKSSEPPRAS